MKWFIHCRTWAKTLVLPYCYGRLFFFAHCLIRVTTFAFNPSTNSSILEAEAERLRVCGEPGQDPVKIKS